MKYLLLTAFIFLLFNMNASSQTLSFGDNLAGHKYAINGKGATIHEFREALSANPKALSTFDGGRGLMTAGTVLGSIGGFALGWGVGTVLAGTDMSPSQEDTAQMLMIAGGIGVAGGVIMSVTGNSSMRRGVRLYNDTQTARNINIGFTANGVGLAITF